MTHTNSNFFRSKSLHAEWEDLSRSVGDVLLVNEGPGFKAEGRSQITRAHWVNALERKHCAEKYCHKKFSLTERKHHCRRCIVYILYGFNHSPCKLTFHSLQILSIFNRMNHD